MSYTLLKLVISAAVLVAVSEISKRSSFIGGLVASLPLTSLLAIMWLWKDTHDTTKIASLSTSIFWMVLPSLVLFIALPLLLKRGVMFWPSFGISIVTTILSYGAMILVLNKCGIKL